jgi:hypothetical protein
MRNFLVFISAFLFALGSGLVIFFLVFVIAIRMVPNETPDGHVEMAVGQVLIGLVCGAIGFMFILPVSYIRIRKKINQ